MKTENFIKRYAHTHTEPDQKFCPIFAISWEGHNKELGSYRKYYVPYNGVLTVNEKPEIIKWYPYGGHGGKYNYCSSSSYGYKGAYVKNIGHDVLEIAKIEMVDGSRGQEGEKRKWIYERYSYNWKRLFIDRKTMLPYDEHGNRLWREDDGKFYNRTLVRELSRITSHGRKTPNNLGETLQEFCGCNTAPIGWGNSERIISTFWELAEFIKKEKERPVSDLTAKLLTYELPVRNYMGNTIEFNILDDKYAVFRLFKAEETYDISIHRYVSTGTSKEAARIFIDNKGKVSIMENTLNGYRVVGKDLSSIVYFYGNDIQGINYEKLSEWKPIKWNMEMFDNITYNSFAFLKNLILVLRHPIIEKLYKSGYKELAKQYMRYGNEIISNLKEIFMLDKINERRGSVYKILGVNKELLSRVEGVDRYSLRIKEMKQMLGRTDITDLSAETIELYLAGLKKLGWHYWGTIIDVNQWQMRNNPRNLTDEERHLIEKLFRLEMKESGAVRTYLDAKEIYKRLLNKPEIDFTDFKNLEDITVLHDNLLALERADREERNRLYALREEERKAEYKKKFDKLQEDRIEKFESHGEKYSIVVPKSLAEITSEGMALNHCVGSYLESHAQGNTNIVFLRKNDEIDTSFYTIEVNPQNYVVQIHGKHNRWLGNDPDAISFVWKWIKDRGFECEKYKLLNTGTGYGKGKDEVSETYLVA